eukprot:TRINITY_DN399_c0_g1_i1.p1 TRINITY_DN399_c0_g1~~TRINITY_DN399_c0_g1_i1.p1  ORF type:complete len:185 (+),score=47.82 TRINITY_DN399_c0_g1_i1:941-1495(+)
MAGVKSNIENLSKVGKAADNLKLAFATLLLQNKQKKAAIKALQSVEGLRHYPALVSTITEMLSGGGDDEVKEAVRTFDSAIEFWSSNNEQNLVLNFQLQKTDFLLKNNRFDEVRDIFQTLKSDEHALQIQAGLVKAISFSDLKKAKTLASSMDEPEDDIPDPMALIESGCVGGLGKRKLKLDRR